MGELVTTVLVEPNSLIREGLAAILSPTVFKPTIRVATVHDLEDFALSEGSRAFFLADVGPDASAGAAAIRDLKWRFPGCCLVAMADRYEPPHGLAALRAGADGYLLKSMSPEALVKSLDLAVLGEAVFPLAILDSISRAGAGTDPVNDGGRTMRPLSEREIDILRQVARGESNKAIARSLEIAEATVKVHIKAILRKISVKNRTQAAIWALDSGHAEHAAGPIRQLDGI